MTNLKITKKEEELILIALEASADSYKFLRGFSLNKTKTEIDLEKLINKIEKHE